MSFNPLDYVYDWSAIASFFVAVAALSSSFIAFRAVKLQETTLAFQSSNFNLQKQKVEEEFTIAWTNQVVSWASECSDVLSEIQLLVSPSLKIDELFLPREKLAKLSSLIDRGRLVFENDKSHDIGNNKPEAYKGLRPKLLDCLFHIYLVSEERLKLSVAEKRKQEKVYIKFVSENRRDFISEIQNVVDPEWFHRRATSLEKRKEENAKNK